MPGRASGVCLAALWNRTMEPGWTLEVTRWVISGAERSFQSKLSTSHTNERRSYVSDRKNFGQATGLLLVPDHVRGKNKESPLGSLIMSKEMSKTFLYHF